MNTPQRATTKSHGFTVGQQVMYHGHSGAKTPLAAGILVTIERDISGQGYCLRDADGARVICPGSAGKYWAAPLADEAPEPEPAPAADDAAAAVQATMEAFLAGSIVRHRDADRVTWRGHVTPLTTDGTWAEANGTDPAGRPVVWVRVTWEHSSSAGWYEAGDLVVIPAGALETFGGELQTNGEWAYALCLCGRPLARRTDRSWLTRWHHNDEQGGRACAEAPAPRAVRAEDQDADLVSPVAVRPGDVLETPSGRQVTVTELLPPGTDDATVWRYRVMANGTPGILTAHALQTGGWTIIPGSWHQHSQPGVEGLAEEIRSTRRAGAHMLGLLGGVTPPRDFPESWARLDALEEAYRIVTGREVPPRQVDGLDMSRRP